MRAHVHALEVDEERVAFRVVAEAIGQRHAEQCVPRPIGSGRKMRASIGFGSRRPALKPI